MNDPIRFAESVLLPSCEDNCALATSLLMPGSQLETTDGSSIRVRKGVPEGHRLAVRPISKGDFLLSWGRPFGKAVRDIAPGDYVCNAAVLEELKLRSLPFQPPKIPNFEDYSEPFQFSLSRRSSAPGSETGSSRHFLGYRRAEARGVGTRNYILFLAAGPLSSPLCHRLQQEFQERPAPPDFDGFAAVRHTEGADSRAHNLAYLLRTLAGFMVHPNVGGAIFLRHPDEVISEVILRDYLREQSYPVGDLPCQFLELDEGYEEIRRRVSDRINQWLPRIASPRSSCPLSDLSIALQCGGSDSFSGVSANPLVGRIARYLLAEGGAANIAETVELVGAESYFLEQVGSEEVAREFLRFRDEFISRMKRHGHSPESNPSAGNRWRGLYNITLKSLGAAMKKDPQLRLDHAVDYGVRRSGPGLYFMNSPGNDLESLAGQVAWGANLIYFTTGSGSITNFPFVPTVKVLSNSARYQLLSQEIDVNAGEILEGRPLDQKALEALDGSVSVASGRKSRGEAAGHSQVSIWRNWQLAEDSPRESSEMYDTAQSGPSSRTALAPTQVLSAPELERTAHESLHPAPGTALILPTSLCSSEVARQMCRRIERQGLPPGVTRIISLPHSEGCGASGGSSQKLFERLLLQHLRHPLLRSALLLEHGCEKVHNGRIHQLLLQSALDPSRFGWASIQLDGGIERVTQKVEQWLSGASLLSADGTRLPAVALALFSPPPPALAGNLAELSTGLIEAGGCVLIREGDPLLEVEEFVRFFADFDAAPNIGFAESPPERGLYITATNTPVWPEQLAGLAASGALWVLAFSSGIPRPGHPFVPVINATLGGNSASEDQFDLILPPRSNVWTEEILKLAARIGAGREEPKSWASEDTVFQVPRGPLGVSV